jgi:predicted metal-dependent peptidase
VLVDKNGRKTFQTRKNGTEPKKSSQKLTDDYTYFSEDLFKGWRKPFHSILILDVSGSMHNYFDQLIQAANNYISILTDAGGIVSVITFDSNARILFECGTRKLNPREGCTGGDIDFGVALRKGLKVVSRNPEKYHCKIVFFTDGQAGMPTSEISQLVSMNIKMDIVIFGIENDVVRGMAICGGKIYRHNNMNEVISTFEKLASTAAE